MRLSPRCGLIACLGFLCFVLYLLSPAAAGCESCECEECGGAWGGDESGVAPVEDVVVCPCGSGRGGESDECGFLAED